MATSVASQAGDDPRLAGWLLRGPAQLADGPHAGAVLGSIAVHGGARYCYPEITGYWLQWLAWRSRRAGSVATYTPHAEAAQRWLGVWLDSGSPLPMRLHLVGDVEDWRNRTEFCFDLAMVLRGLGAAVAAGLLVPAPRVIGGVVAALEGLIADDGMFDACRTAAAGITLPLRWSTQRGGFLAKAAAGITSAAHLPGVRPSLIHAAEATWRASLDAALHSPHDELHPQFYAFEGILSRPHHPSTVAALPAIAAAVDALLDLQRDGGAYAATLPERRSAADADEQPARVDVLAQALRIACLVQQWLPAWVPDRAALTRIRTLLAARVRPDGSLPFALNEAVPVSNVWAAMFADQALALASRPHAADARTADPLIV
ncbi:MAG: hypothetical protein ABIO63_08670 [Casimicrobiaceae bacterium]